VIRKQYTNASSISLYRDFYLPYCACEVTKPIDVKIVFLTFFYFGHFLRFLTFLFSKRFLIFLKNVGKVHSGKQINKKHFQNNSDEIDL